MGSTGVRKALTKEYNEAERERGRTGGGGAKGGGYGQEQGSFRVKKIQGVEKKTWVSVPDDAVFVFRKDHRYWKEDV